MENCFSISRTVRYAARFAHPPQSVPVSDDPDIPMHPAGAANAIARPKSARPLFCNAQVGPEEIRAYCAPTEEVKALLRAASR